jgi:hypothetical protein
MILTRQAAFHLAAAGKKLVKDMARYANLDASILTALFNVGGPALLTKKNNAGETAVDHVCDRRHQSKSLKSVVDRMNKCVAAAEAKRKKEEEDKAKKTIAAAKKSNRNKKTG